MLVIAIHDADSGINHVWGCRDAAAPAVLLTRPTLMSIGLADEGCDLHGPDAVAGLRLAREWGVNVADLAAESYMPADGIRFLLALYATYFRGSRTWAEAKVIEIPAKKGPLPGP